MSTIKTRTLVFLICAVALPAMALAAAIPNGDFSSGVDGWDAQAGSYGAWFTDYAVINSGSPDFDPAMLGASQDVFYAHARNTFKLEDGAWNCLQSDEFGVYISTITIGQTLTAGDGDRLSFRGAMLFADSAQPTLQADSSHVEVSLNWIPTNPDLIDLMGSDSAAITTNVWEYHEILLPVDVAANIDQFTFILSASISSNRNLADLAGSDGQVKTVDVKAYLDDFAFTPEPGSMALLAAGALGLLRRRARA